MCKILANMTQVSDVAPGPLVLNLYLDTGPPFEKICFANVGLLQLLGVSQIYFVFISPLPV
jgi:hypothetical protein